MIAKGTTHNNGVKLANYMTTGKEGERAELWELRGFEATNIKDAFRDVQIMADGTRCQQPFFHVQVRNREGEVLTRPQWEMAANRIERMLGLAGQPRAIAFHTDEKSGHEHMHIAWSRIDQDALKAIELPFFKDRLKKISRELELHFGLEPVTSAREGPIKYAPTRAQEEQARRLGVDIHETRDAIRAAWDRSDSGRSFEVALADQGLRLAQGERRDFIVIDRAGGMHALGKRILGVSAAEIRERMSDLDRNHLPSVQQARDSIHDVTQARRREPKAPTWDRDRDDRLWQDAVAKAAIEKEKTERQFVEPKRAREKGAGRREKVSPFMPPQAKPFRSVLGLSPTPPGKTTPRHLFEATAREATRPDPTPVMPENLKGISAHIWWAYNQSKDLRAFAAALVVKCI